MWYASWMEDLLTWYFVRRVLQTPVRSIMVTSTGIITLDAMFDEEKRKLSIRS